MKRVPKAQLEQIRERVRAAAAETQQTQKKLREDLQYLDTPEARKKYNDRYIVNRRLELVTDAQKKIAKLAQDTAPYLQTARLGARQWDIDEVLWSARFAAAPDPGEHKVRDGVLLETEKAVLRMSQMFGDTMATLADGLERQRWRERLQDVSAERFRFIVDEAVASGDLAVLSVCEDVARTRRFASDTESAHFKSAVIAAKNAIAVPERDENFAIIDDIESAWRDHESAHDVIKGGGLGVDNRAVYREWQTKHEAEKNKPAEEPVNQ